MTRDPRMSPIAGDRVLVRAEGTERIVTEVKGAEVIWRFAGGAYRRTVTLHDWRTDTMSASVVVRWT